MINEKIVPISLYGFRFPTETEMAIDETLKLCGISGEDASMIAIEVMKKLGKSDEIPVCCRGLAEEKMTREEATRINYGEAARVSEEITEKKVTMQDGVDAITVDLARLALMLNELCTKIVGADAECISEVSDVAPNNAPLLVCLVDIRERTRYCLQVARTLIEIVGNR